jgi:hypothetical protein
MSLKFAVVGSLTVLSALGAPARADDQTQDLGLVGLLTNPLSRGVAVGAAAAEPQKPEAGGRVMKCTQQVADGGSTWPGSRVIKRETQGPAGNSSLQKISGAE